MEEILKNLQWISKNLVLKGEKIRKTLFISVQELGSQCEVKNVRTATIVFDNKIFLHFKIEDVFSLSQTRQYIKKEVDNFFFFELSGLKVRCSD